MNKSKSKNFFLETLKYISRSKLNIFALSVVFIYVSMAILAKLNILGANWNLEVGGSYEAPSFSHLFGTDIFGRSVFQKIIKSTEIAMSVGFVVSIIAVAIGVTLGITAGYFGGKIDELIVWFYTTVSSIPAVMLLISLAFIMGKGVITVYIALGMTSWVGLCQIVRSEVKRHKDREYLQAASAIGASNFTKLWHHILPNIMHVIIIRFALIFQDAVKSEVILSYLGLGVQDKPSWGRMIDDSKIEIMRGVWWQLTFATLFMFVIVLAFNILSDALRDALDPKLRGK